MNSQIRMERVETFDKLLKSGIVEELAKPLLYSPSGRVISGHQIRWVEELFDYDRHMGVLHR